MSNVNNNIKSKNISFYFIYDKEWLGGMYYKKHLIDALLESDFQVNITVYTDKKSAYEISNLLHGLPVIIKFFDVDIPDNLKRVEDFFRRRFNFSLYGLFKFNLRKTLVFDYKPMGILRNVRKKNRIYWIPDLQDKFLPHLFSESQIKSKDKTYVYLSKYAKQIVLSSCDSKKSLLDIYPAFSRPNLKLRILRFAVFHPIIEEESIQKVLSKYNLINDKYFIVSNQFMAHKNHKIVLEAFSRLVKNDFYRGNIKLVLTGRQNDPRNKDFFKSLLFLVNEEYIGNEIYFTGEIDRIEQLILMKYAKAVIQPSLFEGWNSTIEDAKALNQTVVCSNLGVHREQLVDYKLKYFFDPISDIQLMEIMINLLENENDEKYKYDYKKQRELFQMDLINIFK